MPLPEIIFIHGAGSSADFWHEQRIAFPGAHFVNLPGHAPALHASKPTSPSLNPPESAPQSSVLSPQHLIESYADWVASYRERHGLQQVVLNGHSMGGAVALTLALRQPEWLAGLVITGAGARLPVSPSLLSLLGSDYAAAVDLIARESLPPVAEPLTYKQKIRINGVKRHFLRVPREVALADFRACTSFNLAQKVAKIDVPTLCVVGALDAMTPPEYSRYLRGEIRGSRLAIVEGAGHMLPLEKPGEYNDILGDFLLRIERNEHPEKEQHG